MNCDALKKAIREVPDFPKPGILFYDITPILADAKLFQQSIAVLCERHLQQKPTAVAAIDARGFIFGAAVAQKLGVGFIPIRKQGKLPFTTLDEAYDLEYGSATISVHVDAVKKGDTILIVDDLLATGGTAAASARLIERLGGKIVEIAFLIELAGLQGRAKLIRSPVFSAIVYD